VVADTKSEELANHSFLDQELLQAALPLLYENLSIDRFGANGTNIAASGFVGVRLANLLAVWTSDDERLLFFGFWHRAITLRLIGVEVAVENPGAPRRPCRPEMLLFGTSFLDPRPETRRGDMTAFVPCGNIFSPTPLEAFRMNQLTPANPSPPDSCLKNVELSSPLCRPVAGVLHPICDDQDADLRWDKRQHRGRTPCNARGRC
jgi:hypothetical protein